MRHIAALWRALALRDSGRRRSILPGEDGFTLVELVLAMGVMATAFMMLASTLTAGLTATGLGRQRQSANGLANQTMEQVRALPLDTLRKGMNTADLAGDTNITSACGSSFCYGSPVQPCPVSTMPCPEQIVVGQTAATPPLNPHIQTSVVGPTTFKIKTYITNFQNITTSNAYRVTVLVTWTPLNKGGSGQTQAETIVHYPQGCLSTAARAFSGPCQSAFATQGDVPTGSVHVSPHPGTVGISGIPLDHADLKLPKATADFRVEQITVAEGSVQSSGATLQQTGSDPVDTAIQTAGVATNDDPDQPGALYSTASPGTQAAGTSSLTGEGNSLTAAITGGDTGSTTSTPSATTSRNCPNLSGYTNKTDSLPCAAAAMQQASTGTLTLTTLAGSFNLGAATLASSGAQSSPSTAITERLQSAPGADTTTSPWCIAPSGPYDCARVTVTRGPQTIKLAGLPANMTPTPALANWLGYYVQLSGFSDTASAASGLGVGAAVPTASVTGGQVSYYTGAGYTTTAISPSGSLAGGSPDITIPPLVATDNTNGVTITLNGTIHSGDTSVVKYTDVPPGAPGSTTPPGCSTSAPCRTAAEAKPTPVTIDVEYQLCFGTVACNLETAGSPIVDLDLHLDPGTLLAGASYSPKPT